MQPLQTIKVVMVHLLHFGDGLSESISEASCRGPAEDLVSTSFLAVSALNAFACTLLKVAKPQSVTPWSCSFCSCSCLAAGLQ
ncbi:hypothetical protein WJX74_000752 [Apatococcus lobatus]|uniref:Uncharacterized protein n=1 Tax=Apatococcus lobatus TaxID=904363 RepID=A0AAW1R2H3_9CHLO